MGLPDFRQDGLLPAGIHAATLQEVQIRFGSGSAIRQRKQEQLVRLLRQPWRTSRSNVFCCGAALSLRKRSRTIWIIRWW